MCVCVGCGGPYLFPLFQFYNNKVILQQDGAYTSGACTGDAMPLVYNNSVFSPTGNISECGMPLAEWQAKGAFGRLPVAASRLRSCLVVLVGR